MRISPKQTPPVTLNSVRQITTEDRNSTPKKCTTSTTTKIPVPLGGSVVITQNAHTGFLASSARLLNTNYHNQSKKTSSARSTGPVLLAVRHVDENGVGETHTVDNGWISNPPKDDDEAYISLDDVSSYLNNTHSRERTLSLSSLSGEMNKSAIARALPARPAPPPPPDISTTYVNHDEHFSNEQNMAFVLNNEHTYSLVDDSRKEPNSTLSNKDERARPPKMTRLSRFILFVKKSLMILKSNTM